MTGANNWGRASAFLGFVHFSINPYGIDGVIEM